MTDKLKPCQCGVVIPQIMGRPGVNTLSESDDLYRVKCRVCDETTDLYPKMNEAIAAWNKRQGESDE